MGQRKLLGAFFIATLSVFVASELFAQADAIEKRQKLMKSNGGASKAIKGAVGEKDYATIQTKAKDIMGNLEKAEALFPKGSTAEDSRAKPEIWERWDEFSTDLKAARTAATELADAAASKDGTQVGAKFKALGGACSNCHKAFRAKKK